MKRGFVLGSRVVQIADIDARPRLSLMIPERSGRSLGNLQRLGQLSKLAQRQQRRPQREAQIDRLFLRLACFREVTERAQSLLIGSPRLLVSRTPQRSHTGLSGVFDRCLPQLTVKRVVGESLDLLAEAVPVECLDGVDDPCVKLAPALSQEPAVCDLVREGVLERVLDLGEKSCLVEEFRCL